MENRRFLFPPLPVVPALFALMLGTTVQSAELITGSVRLPTKDDSLKFAVIGDSGTGGSSQYQVAEQMTRYHRLFPFDFVLMLGDNLYGGEQPRDYVQKFEVPYRPLLDLGVHFQASLGNHDALGQPDYKHFNMDGQRYYSFSKNNVEFFALDTTKVSREQLLWIEKQLSNSSAQWKICFFHHPIYSSGRRHGSDRDLRQLLEPMFVRYGMNVVFSGHDHFYERIKPQKGIHYFVSGAAGKVRRGNIQKTQLTAQGFDREEHFILIEITEERLYFQAISRRGETIDSGYLIRWIYTDPELSQVE